MPAKSNPKKSIHTYSEEKKLPSATFRFQNSPVVENRNDVSLYVKYSSNCHEYETAFASYCSESNSNFEVLSNTLALMEENINILNSPMVMNDFGKAEVNTRTCELLLKISKVHVLRSDFVGARLYLDRAIKKGSFSAFLEMAEIEWYALLIKYKDSDNIKLCPFREKERLIKACIRALNEALKPENMYLIDNNKEMLIHCSHRILESYLLENVSEATIEDLFDKYQIFLGPNGFYEMMTRNQQMKQPDKVLAWQVKLLNFLKKHKSLITDSEKEMRELAPRLAHSYWQIASYQEFSIHIISQKAYFSLEDLSLYASLSLDLSLKKPEIFTERFLILAKSWLVKGAVETSDTSMLLRYLSSFHLFYISDSPFFEAEPALTLLKKHADSKDPKVKSLVHYIYATLYSKTYVSFEKDELLSLEHYKIAGDLGNPMALEQIACIYLAGLSVPKDFERAKEYCRKSLKLDNADAGILLAEIMLHQLNQLQMTMRKSSIENASSLILTQTFQVLNDTETMVRKRNFPDSLSSCILARIFVKRCQCFLEMDHLSYTQDGSGYFQSRMGEYNANIIKSLETALDFDKNCDSALRQLGTLFMIGLFVKQDLQKARQYLEQLLTLNYRDSYTISQYLFIIYDKLRLKAHCTKEKKELHLKALAHYQVCIKHAEQHPEFMADHGMLLSLIDGCFPLPETSKFISTILKPKDSKEDKNQSLHAIEILLNEKKSHYSSKNILELSQHIINLGKHHLEAAPYFPQLVEIISQFVDAIDETEDDASSIMAVFDAVSKWHLAAANQALEPLFIHFTQLVQKKRVNLGISEWAGIIKTLADCNFSAEIQEKNINYLIKSAHLKELINTTSYKISNIALLFYALSLLDTKASSEVIYSTLAQTAFRKLMSMDIQAANSCDISEVYHAYHHFSRKYLSVTWTLSAEVEESFQHYSDSLKENKPPISNTQNRICELLKKIQPKKDLQMEAYIPEVGRRVDFLYENLVIQYHGTWQHYLYDNQGKIIAKSIKDDLCEEDLARAGYKVVIISREEWGAVYDNEEQQIALLRRKLPSYTAAVKQSSVAEAKYPDVLFKGTKEPLEKKRPNLTLGLGMSLSD
jgi:TPR repeat protein